MFFGKGIITTLVKSDGHMPFTYISLHSSTNSFVPFAPSTVQNSAGIPSGPIALPTFSASIAFVIHYLELLGPLNPHLHQAPIQFPSLYSEVFPFLSYSVSIYSFHLFLISSGSVNSFLVSSFIASLVHLVVFFLVNCPTFAYTKSGRALRSNPSVWLHSFSHHLSLALSVSLLSSLFRRRHVLLPSSVFLFFHFLLSCIFSIKAVVIHDFLVTFPFKYPTFPSALFITIPFKFCHLSSVIPCLKHCTSSSISFLNNSTLVTRRSNFHFFCCLLLGIFLQLRL